MTVFFYLFIYFLFIGLGQGQGFAIPLPSDYISMDKIWTFTHEKWNVNIHSVTFQHLYLSYYCQLRISDFPHVITCATFFYLSSVEN